MSPADAHSPLKDIRTPVTLLTGFLGSGKTTLLNQALRAPEMAGSAVVINEFGQIPIDHVLTATSDDNIFVLENGCLCCTVFGDLVQTMNQLYHAREAGSTPWFDHVVIETSGLADPVPVLQAFLSDPTLAGLFRITTVVATLDAINGAGTLAEHDESVRQLAVADQVVITKVDLLADGGEAGLAKLLARVHLINPAAPIHRVDAPTFSPSRILSAHQPDPGQGGIDAARWLNLGAYATPPAPHDHAGHDGAGHDCEDHGPRHPHFAEPDPTRQIATYALVREDPVPREALQLLLSGIEHNLGPRLLRVKGLVNVLEEPGRPAIIQGAQHLLHNILWLDGWPDADERTRLVFITHGMARADLEEMLALLDRVANRTSQARIRARTSVPSA